MATASATRILRVTGRLCANPTDLSTAFPHGGTALGMVRDAEFRFGERTYEVKAEEWGGIPREIISCGHTAQFAGVLRDYDSDAINAFFLNPQTAASNIRTIRGVTAVSGGNRAGYKLSNKAFKLCFSPRAIQDHPYIIIYSAVPLIAEESVLQLSTSEEAVIQFLCTAIPNSNGKTYEIGHRSLVSLT